MSKSKLIKNKCEIESCSVTDSNILHLHHIIERTESNTNNHPSNLAILCPTHHSFVHEKLLRIIGVFPSTKLPNCRTLIYELNGIKNVDIDEEYLPFKNKSYKI